MNKITTVFANLILLIIAASMAVANCCVRYPVSSVFLV